MERLNAKVPASHQKDGVALLVVEFDGDTEGWYLYGHATLDSPALFDFWNMSREDALALAQSDWGVPEADWQGGNDEGAPAPTLDANGTPLQNGDAVTLIKDLDVKGAGVRIKRGTLIKNIALTDNPEEIDCRTKEVKGLVLKTCFVKKG